MASHHSAPDPAAASESGEPKVAAILHDGGANVDALLADVAQEQRRLGRTVRGLLMTYPEGAATDCTAPMVLVDIASGRRYGVSQSLGSGSASCRADTQGFARASEVLREALRSPPELVIVNRFGALEAEGGGFCAELLELMAGGVPLLTAVATRHLEAWQRFTGGATVLAAQPAAVREWLDHVLAPAASAAA